jgi:hypothetical protein
VLDVAQQPVVPVAVGQGDVGDQLDRATDPRESLEQTGGLLGIALGRLRRVVNFGGVDPEQPDSTELAATKGLDADGVAVDDRGHAHLAGLAIGWFGDWPGSRQGGLDPAGGQREERGRGQADQGLHRATLNCGRGPATGTACCCTRSPGER